MLAIIAAMPEELAPLVARAHAVRVLSESKRSPFKLVTGQWAGRSIAFAVTGDGERNARLGVEALGASLSVGGLVVVGIAGAATDDLAPGALVVAEEVCPEAAAGWRAEPASVELVIRRAGARAARLVSVKEIADSPAAKRELAARPGASSSASSGAVVSVAIDLESATYVESAVRMGIPWSVLRVISDGVDEALPSLLNRSRDEGGAVRRGAVALGLLGAPRALPVLLRMRARLRDAGATLADAVERLLLAGAWPPP